MLGHRPNSIALMENNPTGNCSSSKDACSDALLQIQRKCLKQATGVKGFEDQVWLG